MFHHSAANEFTRSLPNFVNVTLNEYTHANRKNWPNFVHRVSIRILANVEERRPSRKLVANFLHYKVSKLFHTLWRSSHAHELQTQLHSLFHIIPFISVYFKQSSIHRWCCRSFDSLSVSLSKTEFHLLYLLERSVQYIRSIPD